MANMSLIYGKKVELATLCQIRVVYELRVWQLCGNFAEKSKLLQLTFVNNHKLMILWQLCGKSELALCCFSV